MITLQHDCLTFSFPEIEEQIRRLVDVHVESTARKLHQSLIPDQLLEALYDQIDSLRSKWKLQSCHLGEHDSLLATAASLTEADMKSALHEAIRERCPEIDVHAKIAIRFQRTLRIPDDGRAYPLPAGLDSFPLRSVDEYADTAPEDWRKKGGIVMPMYQSEALWIGFWSQYPFAVKIAAGKINAVSGGAWTGDLQRKPQNYVVVPGQPWLDGFSVGKGFIRQFVAMPLGAGYTVEEQLTGKADTGGIQIQVYPMRTKRYFESHVGVSLPSTLEELLPTLFARHLVPVVRTSASCVKTPRMGLRAAECLPVKQQRMGLGAGGMMRQEIYKDPYKFSAWDRSRAKRCFVHLCNSMVWREITGTNPPHPRLTSAEYKRAGIPWYDYYRDDQKPLRGCRRLARVKRVAQFGKTKQNTPLPDDTSLTPDLIIQYGNTRRPEEIREFKNHP